MSPADKLRVKQGLHMDEQKHHSGQAKANGS